MISQVTRWKDQFTKLRIFEMIEYQRVLFIDADTLIIEPIDGIFDEMMIQIPMTSLFHREVKNDEKPLPSNYSFAARSDNAFSGERDHPFPPPPTECFSAGFWVAAPSREMFNYLTSVMRNWRRFNPHTMEQSLLNYAFRRSGPMPWYELGWEWSATWPSLRDLEGDVRSLHEKWDRTGPQELRQKWQKVKEEMETFQGEEWYQVKRNFTRAGSGRYHQRYQSTCKLLYMCPTILREDLHLVYQTMISFLANLHSFSSLRLTVPEPYPSLHHVFSCKPRRKSSPTSPSVPPYPLVLVHFSRPSLPLRTQNISGFGIIWYSYIWIEPNAFRQA